MRMGWDQDVSFASIRVIRGSKIFASREELIAPLVRPVRAIAFSPLRIRA